MIKTDEYCFNQSLSNVIDNAIKYTDKGRIEIGQEISGDRLALSVSDTGIGMNQEFLSRIYEPFSQESEGYARNFQGTGLGLSLVKNFMKICDGEIEINSQPGKGSRFTLYFNLSDEEPPRQEKSYREEDIPSLEKGAFNILLAEDLPETQLIMKAYLKSYAVDVTESVSGAWDMLNSRNYNLILLDLSLIGDRDGLDLVKMMKENNMLKNLPIIAVTAHAFSDDNARCLEAGCTDFMTKPVVKKDLLDKIKSLLQQRDSIRLKK